MKEFIDELAAIRSKSTELGDALATKHKVSVQEPPIVALLMCFNNATLALELTSHYTTAWDAIPAAGLSAAQIKQKRDQNAERLVLLSKTMFTWAMSAVEYAAKRAMEKYPTVLASGKPVSKLYLGNIIKLSADNGLIDASARPLWYGSNTIRNKVVHNNGFGDGAATWKFSNGLSVTMEDGKMIQGTIMTFPLLTSWLLAEYADWCDRFLALENRAD